MQDFYTDFYRVAPLSPAHHQFCERVYGKDLCQHGFVDLAQIELLVRETAPGLHTHILDLGCGIGLISEYLFERTGARITGLDNNALAIELAKERTRLFKGGPVFVVGDINQLELPPAEYDLILSLDSIYFSQDYAATLGALRQALRPGGRMAFFYSYGREPWVPAETFPHENLPARKTPLGQALQALQLQFTAWDLTQADLALAKLRQAVLEELRPAFAAEGNLFLYDSRMGDALGVCQAVEEGLHARYFFIITG